MRRTTCSTSDSASIELGEGEKGTGGPLLRQQPADRELEVAMIDEARGRLEQLLTHQKGGVLSEHDRRDGLTRRSRTGYILKITCVQPREEA